MISVWNIADTLTSLMKRLSWRSNCAYWITPKQSYDFVDFVTSVEHFLYSINVQNCWLHLHHFWNLKISLLPGFVENKSSIRCLNICLCPFGGIFRHDHTLSWKIQFMIDHPSVSTSNIKLQNWPTFSSIDSLLKRLVSLSIVELKVHPSVEVRFIIFTKWWSL